MAGYKRKRTSFGGSSGWKKRKYSGKRYNRSMIRSMPQQFGNCVRLDKPSSSYASGVCKMIRGTESTLQIDSGSSGATAYVFRIDTLLNVAELSTLFDQYMIVGVKALLTPRWNIMAASDALEITYPKVYVWYDCDDASPPTAATAVSTAMQRSNMIQMDVSKPLELYFEPVCAPGVYNGSYAVGRKKTWINMASLGAEHYGMKIAWSSGGSAGTKDYVDIMFKYYLKLKYGQ